MIRGVALKFRIDDLPGVGGCSACMSLCRRLLIKWSHSVRGLYWGDPDSVETSRTVYCKAPCQSMSIFNGDTLTHLQAQDTLPFRVASIGLQLQYLEGSRGGSGGLHVVSYCVLMIISTILPPARPTVHDEEFYERGGRRVDLMFDLRKGPLGVVA